MSTACHTPLIARCRKTTGATSTLLHSLSRFQAEQISLLYRGGSDYHGTTLARCEPLDRTPAFIQSGLSFIVPQELKGTSNRGQNAKNLSLTRGYKQRNPRTNFKDPASSSSRPKKDEGEDMLNDLEVDKAEIKMEQADSKEDFESDASEDYSDIDLSAEHSEENDSSNMEDDSSMSDRDPSRTQIRLDDALVQLEPRETMRIIKRRPATGKIYAKEIKTKFYFPPNHAYSHLSTADLKLTLDTREVYYANSWAKPRFIAELLKYDGVEFRSEQVVPEKGEKKAASKR